MNLKIVPDSTSNESTSNELSNPRISKKYYILDPNLSPSSKGINNTIIDICNKINWQIVWYFLLSDSDNKLYYIDICYPLSGYGYEVVKKLLKERWLLKIWHPLLKSKTFWFSVVKKLKKEWILKGVKFKSSLAIKGNLSLDEKKKRIQFSYYVVQELKKQNKEILPKELKVLNSFIQQSVFDAHDSKKDLLDELTKIIISFNLKMPYIDPEKIDFDFFRGSNIAFSEIEIRSRK